MENLKLAPPKVIYVRWLESFFQEDPDVDIEYLENQDEVILSVKGIAKAEALAEILADKVELGNETLAITVVHNPEEETLIDKYRDAFAGNAAVNCIIENTTPLFQGNFHVVFKPEVVQYQADDISDIHGLQSTLYADLARKIMKEHGNVFYNTDELPWYRK